MTCKSYKFTDIVELEFYPSLPSVIEFAKPFLVYEPVISLSRDNKASVQQYGCVIKKNAQNNEASTENGFKGILYEMTGELSVEESISVSGRKFRCVLSFTIDRAKQSVLVGHFNKLRQCNFNIVVKYINGTQHIIRSIPGSWLFKYNESKGLINGTIEIENISGAQQVIV